MQRKGGYGTPFARPRCQLQLSQPGIAVLRTRRTRRLRALSDWRAAVLGVISAYEPQRSPHDALGNADHARSRRALLAPGRAAHESPAATEREAVG